MRVGWEGINRTERQDAVMSSVAQQTASIAKAPFADMAVDVDRARAALTPPGQQTAVEAAALVLLRSVHLQLLLLDKAARP